MNTLDNPIMEENGNAKPSSIALRYGLIGGLALVALGLVMNLTGMVDISNPNNATNWISNILNYAIFIAVIVLSIKALRDANNGFITFGRAFSVGMLSILVVAVISLIWTYIFFAFIEPGMLDDIVDVTKERMIEQQNMSEEQADQAMGMMSWMWNPVMMSIMGGVGTVVAGLIFSLITAAIMKKNPPEMA